MKEKAKFVLDCPIEIDGVLYKAKAIPLHRYGDNVVGGEMVLGLEKIEEKKPPTNPVGCVEDR